MTRIESFSRFRHAVETWTGEDIVPQVRSELETGGMNADPADIIETERGLFSLILKKNQIFVTKVILHISDCPLSLLNQEPGAVAEYKKGNYDAAAILRAVNKYHFLQCGTLDRMFGSGRRFRYKQSRKTDGKFVYTFIGRNEVELERRNQKLYPCKKCLSVFSRSYGGWYQRENFLPEMFFAKTFHSDWLEDCGCSQDFTPNVYPVDFNRISARVREIRNYTCERCGLCLEAMADRKFLHCHHLHGDKTDNSYRRLRALCIKCHSEQPHHQRMRGSPQYREFMKKFHSGK